MKSAIWVAVALAAAAAALALGWFQGKTAGAKAAQDETLGNAAELALANAAGKPKLTPEQLAKMPWKGAKMMDHSHLQLQVPDGTPIPLLSLEKFGDAMSGINVRMLLKNYAMMPPPPDMLEMSELMSATLDPKTGFVEGHAHLYINGEKISRVYNDVIHVPGDLFRPGVNQVTVTLNNHGHMQWAVKTRKVLATLFVEPEKDFQVKHRFESHPAR